jgi:hypothetical protein
MKSINIINSYIRQIDFVFKPSPTIALYFFGSGSLCFNILGAAFFFKPHMIRHCHFPNTFGIAYFDDTVQFYFRLAKKHFFMPWAQVLIKREVFTNEQTFQPYNDQNIKLKDLMQLGAFTDNRMMFECPFHYITKSKKVQSTTAWFFVNRMTYTSRAARLLFKLVGRRLSLLTTTKHYISVLFESNVGESVGQLRGGTKAMFYEMNRDELSNPFKTINRMNRTAVIE